MTTILLTGAGSSTSQSLPENLVTDGGEPVTDGGEFVIDTPQELGQTLLSGLLAFWKLDEASGNRLDSSGNSRNLVPMGSSAASIAQVAGKLGNAVQIPFSNASLRLDLDGILSAPPFTLAGWFKDPASGQNQGDVATIRSSTQEPPVTVYRIRDGVTYGYTLALTDTLGGQYFPAPADAFFTSGAWHFLRLEVGDRQNIALYVDNASPVHVVMDITPEQLASDYSELVLGNALSQSNMGGFWDAWGLWNRSLTQAEAYFLYNAGDGIEFPFV